jgi:CRP/FNR family cyclic AMP-dependent transcriptional regulator
MSTTFFITAPLEAPMRRNKTWFFRNNPTLAGMSDADLEWMESRSEATSVRRKHHLWEQGDEGDRIYWVRSGILKEVRRTPEGRELTIQFLTKDDVIGEGSVFTPGPRESVVEAYEDVTLYSLLREDFLTLMRRDANLALRMGRVVAQRRQRLERRVGDLLFKTAHARLASLFLDLEDSFGVRDSRGIIINLKLTHREMAALIGATRETVSFAILDLRRDGLVETESKRVIITDEQRLREIAAG